MRIFALMQQERYFLKEWREEKGLSQPKLEAKTEDDGMRVDRRTIQHIEADPRVLKDDGNPLRSGRTIRALEKALDLPAGGLKTDPHKPKAHEPTDEWLSLNKDKIFEGGELLAAKGDLTELELLRWIQDMRLRGIIK
jgi:transcriptional regulator with XRE-family HTH domain